MLNRKQLKEYLQNSYAKVDGLWFLKTEEQFGFEKALESDKEGDGSLLSTVFA